MTETTLHPGTRVRRTEKARKSVNHPNRQGTVLRVFPSGKVDVRWDRTRSALSTTTQIHQDALEALD
jgi:hypothetical protein